MLHARAEGVKWAGRPVARFAPGPDCSSCGRGVCPPGKRTFKDSRAPLFAVEKACLLLHCSDELFRTASVRQVLISGAAGSSLGR